MAKQEHATFGGGCFWCTEAVFKDLKGVLNVTPGYAGGATEHPRYEDVCRGTTGHAEVVQIAFDPDIISFSSLVEIFFSTHDPTTLNRQGNDVGEQYRSVIFYHDDEQKRVAENIMEQLTNEKIFDDPIVTQLRAYDRFYKAEDYHHDYFKKNPDQAYCQMVISPKISKFKEHYSELLK